MTRLDFLFLYHFSLCLNSRRGIRNELSIVQVAMTTRYVMTYLRFQADALRWQTVWIQHRKKKTFLSEWQVSPNVIFICYSELSEPYIKASWIVTGTDSQSECLSPVGSLLGCQNTSSSVLNFDKLFISPQSPYHILYRLTINLKIISTLNHVLVLILIMVSFPCEGSIDSASNLHICHTCL